MGRLGVAALALGVLVLDLVTPVEVSVSVLYVLVVILAAQVFPRQGILVVAAICIGLTLASFLFSPGEPWTVWALFDRALGIFGICVSTILVLRNQASETARVRSEAFLSDAQRLSHTGSVGWRRPDREHVWSDESYRIYGCDPAAAAPGLALMLACTHPEDRDLVKDTIEQSFAAGTGVDFEHRVQLHDGAIRFVRLVTRATRDHTGQVEFVGALMDVTAAREAADALQQVDADLVRITRVTTMGQLAASIAHEINQPLTGVVTNAHTCLHWLNEDTLNVEKARVAAQRLARDGERASNVIRRVQALMTKTPPQTVDVDINALIREVIALTQTELRKREVAVSTELTSGLPALRGDPVQLQQVLLNLVLNAIDAMAETHDRAKLLSLGSRLQDDGNGLIFVRDHGVGLSPETADNMFRPFYTTKPKGMGMGLAICRSIVEAHGGRLWASPAEPGAMFQFTVPTRLSAPQ